MAHTFLSFEIEEVIVGNFITDRIAKNQISNLSFRQQLGTQLHYLIDYYTDRHPEIRALTKLLRAKHGKYAPVINDILLDYVLCETWEDWYDASFEVFKSRNYTLLKRGMNNCPPSIQKFINRMCDGNFVEFYTSKDRLVTVLARMDTRTKFKSNFVASIDILNKNEEEYKSRFRYFFSSIMKASKAFIDEKLLSLEVEGKCERSTSERVNYFRFSQ